MLALSCHRDSKERQFITLAVVALFGGVARPHLWASETALDCHRLFAAAAAAGTRRAV